MTKNAMANTQKPKIAVLSVCLVMILSPVASQTRMCRDTGVSVTYQQETHADLVCAAVTNAETIFKRCALPPLHDPIHIRVVQDMRPGCFGLYHCGENLIEVLAPPILRQRRGQTGVFAHLNTDAYFQTLIVHELAHAVTSGMPCPFDGCIVGPEYVAYVMQVMALDPADLTTFEKNMDMRDPISIEGLNPFILMLDPDRFAQKVWAHHRQQDNPCGLIYQLVVGDVFLDFELYDLK